MPGLYLAAILLSAVGIALIDRRFRLAAWHAPGRTAVSVGVGVAFFLAWDAVGIATGVFVKGDSPLLLGFDLAPHLPVEEPVFLAFLSYLALVAWAGARRVLDARSTRGADVPSRREDAP
ncbi:lycopene cyclase domain-containing protein [Microbacterium hominis]|uniref:Lycopene cyclase domain-containing protein n=1 Tax=Microbacterium hominis TaxID=162426 RepID=A0A7D4Q7L9_9MICO|nr:lycopene cyclase domain-containing protein [Microbacterium hominis]QKJ19139.1 lycopene cyclase domain-containing protein [Microbacterium hominis]